MKRVDEFGRKRFKESRWNLKLSFSETDGALGFSVRWKWANFRDWNIALAQKDGFSPGKLSQVTREMSLRLVNVQPNHGSCLAEQVN